MPMMIQICRSTTRSEVMNRTPPIISPREESSGTVTLITRSSEVGSRPVNTCGVCVESDLDTSSVEAMPPLVSPEVDSKMRPLLLTNCCSILSCS